MKKSLLTLALLAAGSAFAQSSSSSVTLYGIADVAYKNDVVKAKDGAKTETSNMIADGASASRLGFKGERDIAAGLKANFVLEFGIDPTTEVQTIKTRTGIVGLSGGFGGVSFGRRNTLIKDIEFSFDVNEDPNAAGYLGNYARDSRRDDVITYNSPVFAGFSADVQVGFGGTAKTATNAGKSGNAASFGLNYVNGPLAVKLGTETVSSANIISNAKVAGTTVLSALVAPATVTTDFKNTVIGASYDLGVAKLFFVNTSAEQGTGPTNAKLYTNNFGVRVPMGNFTLNANYSNGKALLAGQAVKADVDGVQLSVWYALNKDFTIYGIYGTEQIKHAMFTTAPNVANPKQDTLLAGVRYKF
jgi:predicted porin